MKSAKEIYQRNKQFQEYMDKYMINKTTTIDEELKKAIINDIAQSYEPRGINFREGKND